MASRAFVFLLLLLASACTVEVAHQVPMPTDGHATGLGATATHFAVQATATDSVWVSGFRSEDLACLWTQKFTHNKFKAMIPCPSGLVCHDTDSIRSIDWETGTARWTRSARDNRRMGVMLYTQGDSLLLANARPSLVDAQNGQTVWQLTEEVSIRHPVSFGAGNFFYPTWEGYVEARALADGTRKWASQPSQSYNDIGLGFGSTFVTVDSRDHFMVHSSATTQDAGQYPHIILFDGVALLAYRNDTLMQIGAAGTPVWKTPIRLSQGCGNSKVHDGRMYIISDKRLYQIRLQDGHLEAQQDIHDLDLQSTIIFGNRFITLSYAGELEVTTF